MYDREKNLFDSYAGKHISRRDLLDGAAKLGIAGVAANAAFASAMSRAMAALPALALAGSTPASGNGSERANRFKVAPMSCTERT